MGPHSFFLLYYSVLQKLDVSHVELIYSSSVFKSLATGGNVSEALVSVCVCVCLWLSKTTTIQWRFYFVLFHWLVSESNSFNFFFFVFVAFIMNHTSGS